MEIMSMIEFTKDELISIIYQLDPVVEKEFRKYSSFYATASAEITEEDAGWLDACAKLVGKRIVATGYWSDSDGLDLYDAWVEEKTEEVVPAWTEVIEHPESVKVAWNKI